MDTYTPRSRSIYAELLNAERAVIAACLMQPARIPDVAARLSRDDIVGKVHRQILATLITLSQDGRTPSMQAVLTVLGDEEIEPRLTLKRYLLNLSSEAIEGAFLPWEDAVEVVIEWAHRRRIAAIGGHLSQGADVAVSLSDLVVEATGMLDDATIAMRTSRRLSYDAGGAGAGALARLDGIDRAYPTTGLADLDKWLGGWPLGELSVLAGRPGSGKSAVASSTLLRTVKAGNPAVFFSLEMTRVQLGARMLTDLAYDHKHPIAYEDVVNRRVDPHARRRLDVAQEALAQLPIKIEEQRGLTVAEIAARSRKHAAALLRARQQLRVIFVDHMMLVRSSDRYSGNRVREVGEISEGLNELAQELDVAMVALCQLNRQVEGRENKRPTLSDLRDSGEIEQNASLVTFLYRPAYYLERTKSDDPEQNAARDDLLTKFRNKLEIIIDKNRNGRVGVVEAFVDIGANAVRNASFSVRA